MTAMTYKGYSAGVEYDAEDRIFWGRLAGITDIVSFEGRTVEDLEADFRAAVDAYLDSAEELGLPAQKPYSGKILLRVPPEVHARVAMLAEAHGKSLNQFATELLSAAK